MAPPAVLSMYEQIDMSNSQSPTSFLLSPFPATCFHQSLYSDHDYIIKASADPVTNSSPSSLSLEDAFGCPVTVDQTETLTPGEDGNSSFALLKIGDSEVSDDVFDDVGVASQQGKLPMSGDTDFLQGLDELEFDFEDLDPSCDVAVENTFQSFIDATLVEGDMDDALLDSSSNNSSSSILDGQEDDDVYKKDFFMKHLGLQRVSQKPPQRKNRKRKYEEDSSEIKMSSRVAQTSSVIPDGTTATSNTFPCQFTFDTHSIFNNTRSSPRNHRHLSFPSHSVPYKLCSCSTSDWQRTVLYSTAKSSGNAGVQTSPSTASISPRLDRQTASFFSADIFHQEQGRLSPTELLSHSSKDDFEFEFLAREEIDEETEDLLSWLDTQDIHTTITGSTSSFCSPLASSQGGSPPSMAGSTVQDCTGSPNGQDSMAMDSFVDLESYVSEDPDPEPKPAQVSQAQDPLVQLPADLKSTNNDNIMKTNSGIFPKPHLRLSILADISNGFLNTRSGSKKDAFDKCDFSEPCHKRHIRMAASSRTQGTPKWNIESPFSPSSSSSPLSSSSLKSSRDSVSEFSPPSPFSSSSSSSSSSSPTSSSFPHISPSKNLELLDLFSDENSSMLLGGSEVSISNARFM